MYVARNHSMHLALRYWLVILSLSVSLSLSLSLPLPCQADAADSPPPADVKRVCIFIRGEFQRVTRSKINFPLPCASRFAPPPHAISIYAINVLSLPLLSHLSRALLFFFVSFLPLSLFTHFTRRCFLDRKTDRSLCAGTRITLGRAGLPVSIGSQVWKLHEGTRTSKSNHARCTNDKEAGGGERGNWFVEKLLIEIPRI